MISFMNLTEGFKNTIKQYRGANTTSIEVTVDILSDPMTSQQASYDKHAVEIRGALSQSISEASQLRQKQKYHSSEGPK